MSATTPGRSTPGHSTPGHSTADVVGGVVERVRADLADRRRRGELPTFPRGELDRQFSAVVEAADAGLVEEPPVAVDGYAEAARLDSWRPVPVGSPLRRLVVLAVRLPARLVGLVVRRQLEPFAARTHDLIGELAHRQNNTSAFLARAHLDRVRSLEYRIAQLEEELTRLRSSVTPADADAGADAGADVDAG